MLLVNCLKPFEKEGGLESFEKLTSNLSIISDKSNKLYL